MDLEEPRSEVADLIADPASVSGSNQALQSISAKDVSPNELVIQLARILHTCGAPADELEHRMGLAARTVGVPANFFSTPTSLFVTFEDDADYTRLIRVWPSETNLAKLAGLYDLYQRIEEGQLNVAQAWRELQDIDNTNYDYGNVINVVCHGIVSAGVGVFVGGNLTVIATAGIIGLIIGVLVRSFERLALPGHLTNVVAGFIAVTLASLAYYLFPGGSVALTLLAGLIILLPGLQITVSVNELATQNLASGTARMAGAMTTFLTMIFGVVMGYGFVDWFVKLPPPGEIQPLGLGWYVAALLPVALSFCVMFRARVRDIPWILLSIGIAFGTVKLTGLFLGPLAASWSAALAVGIFSNLFARWRNRPAAIMLMPGLLMLVPGSLGFFGVSEIMINDDMPGGLKFVSTMMLVAVSLVAGLLISNAIVPVEKTGKNQS